MLTFSKASEFISKGRKKTERKLAGSTVARIVDDNTIAVKLYDTDIVLIHRNGNYTLNTGGWRTVTTKERINEYTPARLYQEKGNWYIGDTEFTEGMVVDSTGKIVKGGNVRAAKKRTKLMADVKRYINGFAAQAVKNGGLEKPGSGDCLICQIGCQHPQQDNPESHVLDHIRENYYVPSLLVLAIRHRNPNESAVPIVWGICDREVKEGNTKYLKTVLRAYFRKIMPKLTQAVTPTVAA
jgi:hypothetical protein